MTSPVGLLDFFILEANDSIDRLDAAISGAATGAPDIEVLLRHARTLRGSSTMARQNGIAEVAGGIERVARALRDREVTWSQGLHAALIAGVDDLKLLIRSVRNWSTADERRAQSRTAELARLAPDAPRRTPTPGSGGGSAFLVAETGDIADALEQIVRRPSDRDALDSALRHVRTLRGVASIGDVPPLPEVVDAIERAAKPVELGVLTTPSVKQLALLTAAAMLLRRISTELGGGRRPDPGSPEVRQFAAAAAALAEEAPRADHIVPIAALFHGDRGPHLVSTSPNPPTTPAERFRMEVVSQAEHLRRLVADARVAKDPASRDRLGRELRVALLALEAAAVSFGETRVARIAHEATATAASLEPRVLESLDRLAALLADPRVQAGDLARELDQLGRPGHPAAASAAPSRSRSATPTGQELKDFLDRGIETLGRLEDKPLREPTPLPDEAVVPIQDLLYRGRAAVERARTLRDELRRRGGSPSQDVIDELYDLLDLALVD
ncbi:MAG TPA: Hpt domain-containing protein [Gemmatimonadaceae bacterium]|nr:Hpt domain-containing protein [Gemmatimonadaceae bacterium]